MKSLSELTEQQAEIYKIRKNIKDSMSNVKEDRIFNFTIEMYNLIHYKENRIMDLKDYKAVKEIQDKK